MIELRKERIWQDFKKIRRAWPDAMLSQTFRFVLIPGINLPEQFNYSTTPLLIKLNPDSDYKEPESYVRRELRVNGRKSRHLDEKLTDPEMLDSGWVKLCVRVHWNKNLSLIDYLIMALEFLEGLRE